MTALVSHGYSDWNRTSVVADVQFFDLTNQVINVLTTHNVGFVGNYPSLGTRFLATTNNFLLEFFFYQDAAFTIFMDNYSISANQGTSFNRNLPVLGPYLQVQVQPSAAASQYNFRLWASSPFAIPSDGPSSGSILISQTALVVTALTTTTLSAPRIYPGEAYWNVMSDATSWEARLRVLDDTGTPTNCGIMRGVANSNFNYGVYLPPVQAEIRLQNNDAVNRNFWAYLTTRPWFAGA